MSEPFIAEIIMFGGNFAPRGWAFCDGQLLSISSNTALFSILGTTFGGDGRTTFALPDMRGRVSVHPGTGPGLSNRRLGERGGTETVGLNASQIPSHNHTFAPPCSTNDGTADSPANNVPRIENSRKEGFTKPYSISGRHPSLESTTGTAFIGSSIGKLIRNQTPID